MLRPWQVGDATGLQVALGESVDHLKPWIPWAPPAPPTIDETADRLSIWIEEFRSGTTYIFAAFDRSDSSLIGGVGLYPRVGPDALEIGYWIRLARAGCGFATEASQALTHVGFSVTDISRIEIHTSPANLSSARVPEKLGYALLETRPRELEPGDALEENAVFTLTRARYASVQGVVPRIWWPSDGAGTTFQP
jgi:RimJ/RimL family protein N-acetyltransferase